MMARWRSGGKRKGQERCENAYRRKRKKNTRKWMERHE